MSNKITSPDELRATLLSSIEAIIEGRMTAQQANAVAGLSAEVHKSIKQEWDMKMYAAENLSISHGELKKMMEM